MRHNIEHCEQINSYAKLFDNPTRYWTLQANGLRNCCNRSRFSWNKGLCCLGLPPYNESPKVAADFHLVLFIPNFPNTFLTALQSRQLFLSQLWSCVIDWRRGFTVIRKLLHFFFLNFPKPVTLSLDTIRKLFVTFHIFGCLGPPPALPLIKENYLKNVFLGPSLILMMRSSLFFSTKIRSQTLSVLLSFAIP